MHCSNVIFHKEKKHRFADKVKKKNEIISKMNLNEWRKPQCVRWGASLASDRISRVPIKRRSRVIAQDSVSWNKGFTEERQLKLQNCVNISKVEKKC